jgi:lipopolysaccharide export system protein LptC
MDLPTSTFELNSRILRSNERTTITRADFTISGDALEFNTIERQGTLKGNVKMVITNRSAIEGNRPK